MSAERYVTRAAVVRVAYALRAEADRAAEVATDERGTKYDDSVFHTGRQAGMLQALTLITEVLEDEPYWREHR